LDIGPSRAGEHVEGAPQRPEAHHSSGAHARCVDRSGTSDRSFPTVSYHKCRSSWRIYCNRMRKPDGDLIQIFWRWELRRSVFQGLCCRRCACSLAVEGPYHVKQFHKLCCHRCVFPLAVQQLQSMNPCLSSSRSGGRKSSNSGGISFDKSISESDGGCLQGGHGYRRVRICCPSCMLARQVHIVILNMFGGFCRPPPVQSCS